MTLAQKAALTVTLFAIANLGFAFAIKHNWIDPSFEGFERRLAEKSMAQVAEAIEYTVTQLDNRAHDYASWDSTYEYALSGNPDYYEENLSRGVLTNLGIDWLAVVDKSGRVVSGPIRDVNTYEPIAIPDFPDEQWELTHTLLSGDTRKESVSGMMVTEVGPVMVAARDILTSLGTGESHGRVAIGRAVDDAFIRDLSERVGLDLRIWVKTDPEIPTEVHSSLAGDNENTLVTMVGPESNHLEAYHWFDDVVGNPSLVIRADLPRDIAHSASYIAQLCLLWIVLQAAILVFIILVPLNRAIIAPLGVLSRQLRVFRKTSELDLSLDTESAGEIGEISREFGNMLSQLEEQIRERQKGEEALRQNEQHLRAAQQIAQMGSWKFDLSDGSWWWSEELFRIYGRDAEAGPLTGEELRESIHPGDRERVSNALRGLIEGTEVIEGTELRVLSSTGALRHYSLLWNVERSDDGKAYRVFGTANDVTERRCAEEQLRRAAVVFDTATESIVIANSTRTILDVNSAFSATTGYSRDEVVGQDSEILSASRHGAGFIESIFAEVSQVGKWEGEIWIRRRIGKPIPAWVSIGCAVGEQAGVEQYVVVFNDMTERKNAEEVIAQQANYDMLTKLPNRYLFKDRLRRALLRAKREKASVGLLFIDLDSFKKINDSLGHAVGDEALRHAAKRVSQALRGVDTAARLGGDEFAIILPGVESALHVEGVARRILAAVSEPLEVHDQDVVLAASIGAAIYPTDSDNDEDLLRDADIAMYRSKKSGGNALEFFTDEMNESAARRLLVESHLRKALELGEFEVYYQPIVALPEVRLVGVEALLRWENPELGAVSPGEFISIAERSGLIGPIGAWVLETACCQVKAWHDAGWPRLRIAVNLSPREVDRGDAVGSIENALDRSGLPAECLEIEVTERVFLDDVERVATIFSAIKDLGVRLCIDDFGTGYSSLSYLQNYPFDVLKIDRAFVHGAIGHEDGVALLQAINSMAESLRLDVVAEGVETQEQMDLLIELGCGFAQGFYFCEPMTAESLEMGGSIAALLVGSTTSE